MVSYSRMFKYVPRSVRPLVQLEKNIVTRNLSASSFSSYHVSNIHSNSNKLSLSRSVFNTKEVSILSHRVFSTDLEEIDQEDKRRQKLKIISSYKVEEKPGLVKKFKQMFKDYWLGGFYVLLKSGVDIVGVLENLGTSERIMNFLKESEAGYIALSYACYKIATPARYTVTLGGTTYAINKLKDTGYLKSTSEYATKFKKAKKDFKDSRDKSIKD